MNVPGGTRATEGLEGRRAYLTVNKNLVELAALLVILVTGSGRFAGLDRFLHVPFAKRARLATACGGLDDVNQLINSRHPTMTLMSRSGSRGCRSRK